MDADFAGASVRLDAFLFSMVMTQRGPSGHVAFWCLFKGLFSFFAFGELRAGIASPIIVTDNEQRFLVAEQLRLVDVVSSAIVLEPASRNTAPAIAVAALLALRDSPDALLLVLPSDHVIRGEAAFIKAAGAAAQIARDGYPVTFGITPTETHTGYGDIRSGASLVEGEAIFAVDSFVEKPDAATAQRFLDDGSYYWSAVECHGMP